MSLPKYRSYKDSGVSWLEAVPSHWKVQRLKYACTVFPSNVDKHSRDEEPSVRLCNYTDVYYSERITSAMTFMEATASEDQIAKFSLKADDTIITKDSETADDIAIAAYVPEDLPGVVCGYHLSMVRPRPGTAGAFVKRLFDSVYAKARFAVAANGLTRVGLGQYALDNVELPFPPVDEQTVIATFLDRETSKIDALIAEQEKLIALLAEKRQATISHAVTRGLNPNAPMKDSGVAWLEEIPAHWGVTRLKYATKLIVDCPHETPIYDVEGTYSVIRTADVTDGRLWTEDMYLVNETEYLTRIRRQSLKTDDIVYGREGERWGYAAQVHSDDMFCLGQRMMQFRATDLVHARYLMWQLNSLSTYRQGQIDTVGATSPHVNVGTIRNYVLANPPLSEQLDISAFIDAETSRLDALDVEAVSAIALLKERRSALIAAAVTGQIDVRTA
jgi:type I restriction enzyme S subunit